MKIRVVAVGGIKQKYVDEGVCDYRRRLSKYGKIDIIEVKDEKTANNPQEEEALKKKEGQRLLSVIRDESYTVCLDMKGKKLTSEQLAEFISERKMERVKELVFVIGGSSGLSEEVLLRADFTLSFSDMTFPHGLMRLILLEQLYRAEKILKGEPYHK